VDCLSPEHLQPIISTYGYWVVTIIVGLESMGLPQPGETVLVLAALYAGGHHDLNI
jgi:membrane protein DedA with SNARE-associated domain